MAASTSRTGTNTLVLLGLVVAAYLCVAAEATARSHPGDQNPAKTSGHGGQAGGVSVVLKVKLHKGAQSAVSVLVQGAVATVGGAKSKAVQCAVGVVTEVRVLVGVGHVVAVDVLVGGPRGVVAQVVLDVTKVGTVVGGVHYVALDVVENVKSRTLDVLCVGVRLKTISLAQLFVSLHL